MSDGTGDFARWPTGIEGATTDSASPAAPRPGEIRYAGPAPAYDDAGLVFIGRLRSPWKNRAECPKNMRTAREAVAALGSVGVNCSATLDARWRPALADLVVGQPIFVLSYLDRTDREIAVQVPRRAQMPRGTFSLRSPVRPNPIGLHLTIIVALDRAAGIVGLDAIDVLDGTPLLDIKPYFESVDRPPV